MIKGGQGFTGEFYLQTLFEYALEEENSHSITTERGFVRAKRFPMGTGLRLTSEGENNNNVPQVGQNSSFLVVLVESLSNYSEMFRSSCVD